MATYLRGRIHWLRQEQRNHLRTWRERLLEKSPLCQIGSLSRREKLQKEGPHQLTEEQSFLRKGNIQQMTEALGNLEY